MHLTLLGHQVHEAFLTDVRPKAVVARIESGNSLNFF